MQTHEQSPCPRCMGRSLSDMHNKTKKQRMICVPFIYLLISLQLHQLIKMTVKKNYVSGWNMDNIHIFL